MNAGFMKFIPQIQRKRGKKKPHHIHGYRLQEYTVHSRSSALITVKLLACRAPASSPPLPEQQAFTCTPTCIRSFPLLPISFFLTPFLARGIPVFNVPLIHKLGLGKTKSPLCLEVRGYSPVNIPTGWFLCCPCLPYLGYCFISCLLPAAASFALTPGHYAG